MKSKRARELMREWAKVWRMTRSTFALEVAAGLNRVSREWRALGQ